MNRLLLTLCLLCNLLPAFAGNFTPGNVVVLRVGDGSTALSSSAAPVFLDEYNASGTLVQSIALPVADNGSNQTFTISGTATSEGSLTLSGNSAYLTLAGYDAAPGTATVASATGVNRIIARVDATGTVNTTTGITLDSAYRTNSIRGAYTIDGSAFWCSGNGSSNTGGTYYLPFGSISNPVQLSSSPVNTRVVKGFNGQLYTSSASGTFHGVSTVGTGFPTTTGQTTTILPGLSTTTGPSVNGFVIFDLNPNVPGPDVLYVADDRTTSPDGGIYKYSLVGGSWVSNGNISSADPLRGITGSNSCGQVTLLATSEGIAYGLVDNTGYNQTLSATLAPLITAGTNKKFRGIAFTPGSTTTNGLTATISSATNPNCNGSSNGATTVSVNGNTGTSTYLWSNGATTQALINLAAGTYVVTVTDQAGCFDTASVTLTQPAVITATPTITNVSCNAGANGTITLAVSGGTGAYTYHWYDNTNNSSHNSLAAGNYAVTITDINSCSTTASFTVTQPAALNISGQATHVTCAGGTNSGAVNATISGGTNPYSYNWNNGATTEDLNNIPGGTYVITVTDSKQCTASSSYTVNQPASVTGTAQVTNSACSGGNTGAINLTPGGGSGGPYTFVWNTGSVNEDISGLGAGTYTVTVTDNGSCSASFAFTVSSSGNLAINAQQTNAQCNGSTNGSITTAPSGGSAPYTYSWSNGSTGSALNNIAAGSYAVTVSDNSGCQITGSYTITEPSALNVTSNVTNVTCNGNNNGAITLSTSGGNGPYSYSWNDSNSSQNRTNLTAGNYAVTVSDSHNCTVTHNASVSQPALLQLTLTPTDVSVLNGTDGAVNASTSGGTGGVSYFWSNSANTQNISGLSAGNYCVTATDANGCTATACAQVQQPVGIAEQSNISSLQSFVEGNVLVSTVSLANAELLHYEVVGLNGQLLYSENRLVSGKTSFTVPVDGWAAGLYLVRVNGAGKPVLQKITVQ